MRVSVGSITSFRVGSRVKRGSLLGGTGGQDLEQKIIIERGGIALHGQTHLRGFSLQQTHTEATEEGHILRGISLTNPTGIFVEGDIEDPMEAIFHTPVGANHLGVAHRIRR